MQRTLIATCLMLTCATAFVPSASATWCISMPGFICQTVDGALSTADAELTYQEACANTPHTPYGHADCAAHGALPNDPFCLPLSATDLCVSVILP